MSVRTFIRDTPLRTTLAVTAVAAAVATVGGCSSTGTAITAKTTASSAAATSSAGSASSAPTSTASASGSASSASSSSSTTAGSAGSVPTGTQLAALFAGAKPPNGYTLASSGATDSGPNLVNSPGSYIALKDCTDLTNASNHGFVGDYESSEAENTIHDDHDTRVDVMVGAYAPGDADKQWSELTALFAKCPTYQADVLGGGKVTVKVVTTPVSGLGDKALDLKLQATTAGYVSQHTLLIHKGDRIISVDTTVQQAAELDLKPFANGYIDALTK